MASPYHAAVLGKDELKLRAVIAKHGACGAMISDSIGRTPLHWAVTVHNEPAVKVLLVNVPRSSLSSRDCQGRTTLHYAAAASSQSLRLILDRSGDVNCADNRRITPLHLAAEHATPETVKMLLNAGASVESKDDQGRTPRDYAERAGNQECAAILFEHVKARASKVLRAATPLSSIPVNVAAASGRGGAAASDATNRGAGASPSASLEDLMTAWKATQRRAAPKEPQSCSSRESEVSFRCATVTDAAEAMVWPEVAPEGRESAENSVAAAGCKIRRHDTSTGGAQGVDGDGAHAVVESPASSDCGPLSNADPLTSGIPERPGAGPTAPGAGPTAPVAGPAVAAVSVVEALAMWKQSVRAIVSPAHGMNAGSPGNHVAAALRPHLQDESISLSSVLAAQRIGVVQ